MPVLSNFAQAKLLQEVRELRAECDELLSAAWQPITTASKDGTCIDLWADGERYANAFFGSDSWDRGPMWVCADPCDGYVIEVLNPTHWRHLPKAPE